MKRSLKFAAVFLVIISVVFVWFWYSKKTDKTSKSSIYTQVEQTLNIYKSEKYGFSFSYPEPYEIMVYSPENIVVGNRLYGSFDQYVSVQLLQGGDEIEIQSFEEFVIDMSRLACSSDTAEKTILCDRIDDVVKIAPFSTKSGVKGQVFNLKGEETDKVTNKSKTIRRGPFYTFNTSSNTPNRMSFLMIGNPISKTPQDANYDLIQFVASSMTFKSDL